MRDGGSNGASDRSINTAIHNNQYEVITHLDVHATMMDVIERQTGPHPLESVYSSREPKEGVSQLPSTKTMGQDTKEWRGWRYGQDGFPGQSLFRPLPLDRGCERAGVDMVSSEYCLIGTELSGVEEDVLERIQSSPSFARVLGPSVLQAASSLNPGAILEAPPRGRTPSLKLAHCRMTHQQPVLCLDPSSEQFREPADGSHTPRLLVPLEVHPDADGAPQLSCEVPAEESDGHQGPARPHGG